MKQTTINLYTFEELSDKAKEEARQIAIDWQAWQGEQSLSYGEIAEWEGFFRELAVKFNLVEELKENGII